MQASTVNNGNANKSNISCEGQEYNGSACTTQLTRLQRCYYKERNMHDKLTDATPITIQAQDDQEWQQNEAQLLKLTQDLENSDSCKAFACLYLFPLEICSDNDAMRPSRGHCRSLSGSCQPLWNQTKQDSGLNERLLDCDGLPESQVDLLELCDGEFMMELDCNGFVVLYNIKSSNNKKISM